MVWPARGTQALRTLDPEAPPPSRFPLAVGACLGLAHAGCEDKTLNLLSPGELRCRRDLVVFMQGGLLYC